MKLSHIFSFGNTILDLDRLHDLRVILKRASQSAQFTHRERSTALEIIQEIDDMSEDLTQALKSDKPPRIKIEMKYI